MKAIKHIRGRREMKKEQARQAIISSTKKCFSQKGVSKTSIVDITKRANMAVGTFYNYFASKDDILLSFATNIIEFVKEDAKARMEKGKTAKETMRDVINVTISELGEYEYIIPFLITEEKHKKQRKDLSWAALTRKLHAIYADVIKYGQKRNEFRKDVSAVIAAEMVHAIFQSAIKNEPSKMSISDNIKTKIKVFLAGMEKKK